MRRNTYKYCSWTFKCSQELKIENNVTNERRENKINYNL